MADIQRWHAELAWLGGDDLDSNVLIEVDDDGRITGLTADSDRDGAEILPGIVLPGLVSAHSHAFHRLLRGHHDSGSGDFWAWRQRMYGLAGSLSPESYFNVAKAVFTEMLLSGITTVGEFHYLHNQADGTSYSDPNAMGMALVAAAEEVGIRLTLLDTAYLRSSVYGDPPTPAQLRFSDGSPSAWSDRVGDLATRIQGRAHARLGLAAHSVRALAPDEIEMVGALARSLDVPAHVHVSEQPQENEDCLRAHGVTPVGLLADVGFLGPDTTLVHGTHVTAADVELISAAGANVCVCPTTEADLGDGMGPVIELASAGVPLSLGSDSNVVIDIIREAGRMEQHERLRLGRRGVHSPASLMTAATSGGARSLGWETGRIAEGCFADLVSLDTGSLELAGTRASLASVALHATRASIQQVIVGGREIILAAPTFEEAI